MLIKKTILWIVITFICTQNIMALENKILFKIDREIITSLDIYNEKKYLILLNKELKSLEDNKIFEIAKNSIIREKIKKNEILKKKINLNIDDEYLEPAIKTRYSKIGINNLNDLKEISSAIEIDYNSIKEKIIIELIWNNLIFKKYSSKININKEQLKKEILENNKKKTTSYFLYEIIFNVKSTSEIEKKYKIIKNDIVNTSFNNAASIHSISNSSNSGGELGWINESSLNKNIKKKLSNLSINEHTDPISTPSGFLILMVGDKKEIEKKINLEDELRNLVNIKTNQQLSQFSVIYFNKIKKDQIIDEL